MRKTCKKERERRVDVSETCAQVYFFVLHVRLLIVVLMFVIVELGTFSCTEGERSHYCCGRKLLLQPRTDYLAVGLRAEQSPFARLLSNARRARSWSEHAPEFQSDFYGLCRAVVRSVSPPLNEICPVRVSLRRGGAARSPHHEQCMLLLQKMFLEHFKVLIISTRTPFGLRIRNT